MSMCVLCRTNEREKNERKERTFLARNRPKKEEKEEIIVSFSRRGDAAI
jgi:hypothetical protein|tara:strand:+ start:406 stop:552 length:147 start_codon:yes stop_codon:yes gene_type:complete